MNSERQLQSFFE